MIKARNLKPIKAGYDDDKIAVYPRAVSRAELDSVELALAEAGADTVEKYQKAFEIKRQAIADWSSEMPATVTVEKGESKLVPIGKGDIAHEVNTYFAARTIENEHVVHRIYGALVGMQSVDVDFL